MVDIENKVFNAIYNAVVTTYPTVDVAIHYVNEPSSFPHVQVYEESNTSPRYGMNLNGDECFSNLVYHIELFDNGTNGSGKTTCKAMLALIDPVMRKMGFRRTYYAQVPNYQDATIFRMVTRYSRLQEN